MFMNLFICVYCVKFMVGFTNFGSKILYFLLCNKKSRCDFDDKLKVGNVKRVVL